ncbi:MAG: PAS domain-containing sensor histidine kinase [Segetibacter sp.]
MIKKDELPPAFLNDGGQMGERIRLMDWNNTAVGNPQSWPQSLRTSINILLNSQFPMFVWWGKDLVTFYNDSYIPVAGEKHPDLLGKSGKEGWAEIWAELEPLVEKVFRGTSTWSEDLLLNMNRHGYIEETYFTFSYSPIFNDFGSVEGLFCACIETTEKVLATRRIEESERNLRNTILQSPVAMCILRGTSFVVEIANVSMFELWGRAAEKILQKPIFDGLPEARQQGLEEILINVYQTGEEFLGYERPVMLPRSGTIETVFINFVYRPFRNGDGNITGIIAVAIDVTQQVLARKKIEESEQELQLRVRERTAELEKQTHLVDNILRNSSNGISVTEMIRDEKGVVIDARTILANEAAVRNTGLSSDVYLSKTAIELDPNIIISPYGPSCIETLKTRVPFVIQYFLEITGRWLELTVSRMDEDHLIHIFTDVTSIKEAQLQLERTVDELKRSNVNLEQFAYAASHDLKEPIRKISTFSERLQRELAEVLSENQLNLFKRMNSATERMSVLIDDLLTYSHATKGILNVEEIDLNKKVQLVLEDLELQVQEKKVEFLIDLLPTVKGNRRQFQQLFHNLLNNALKYSKSSEPPLIHICYALKRGRDTGAKMEGEEGNQYYHVITVKDNGIGFEQKYSEEIFNIFARLHSRVEYAGSGVGLSIVRRVVENHKGYICAESEPGEGSVFTIILPSANT